MRISDWSSDVCSSDLAYADAIDLRSSGNRLQTRRSDARNLGTLHLVELAIQRGEARLSELGALVVKTGKHTGRSAQDKLIVRDVLTKEDVWWGPANKPMTAEPSQICARFSSTTSPLSTMCSCRSCLAGHSRNNVSACGS